MRFAGIYIIVINIVYISSIMFLILYSFQSIYYMYRRSKSYLFFQELDRSCRCSLISENQDN